MDKTKRMMQKDFIEKSLKVHGKKYDYSKAEYLNLNSRVLIICKVHGIFSMLAAHHLSGQGCPDCSIEKKGFIEFFKIHGSKYDYSKADYYNSHSELSIICKVHGMFKMRAYEHRSGKGCPQCANTLKEKYRDKRMSQKDFIERSLKVHGDKYDFSEAEYLNLHSKVFIICKEHGDFYISPVVFLKGRGCPSCRIREEFVDDAKKIHGEKYDYSGAIYYLESKIEPESEEKTINPFEIEIKNDGPNFTLYRDDIPIKISKKLFDVCKLKKDVLITHTSRDLLEHMKSELDGYGGVKLDEKGKIVSPKYFGSIALFSLQKDLVESEKEELSNQLEGLIFSDPLLLPHPTKYISEQLARYNPLERWLGQSWDELYSLAKSLIEQPLWEEDKKIFKQTTSAECVIRLRDEYKSLSFEERTVVSYLREINGCTILFPMALVKGHCSDAEYAVGIMASKSLSKTIGGITGDQHIKYFEELSSQARKSLEYIKLFRKGTPNKYINDLIENGESQELEFKSTLRWDLDKDKKEDHITNACMKTIAAFMNTNGGKLVIGISDKGECVGIDKDRLKTNDKFLLFLTNSIKNSIGIEALESVNFNIYEIDQHKICIVECKKADKLMYCKKKGEENFHAYIRTGPETIILQPNKFEEYKKRNFN